MKTKNSTAKCKKYGYCPCDKCEVRRADDFGCISCNFNTLYGKEYYMLVDEIWLTVNPAEKGMLCIGCVEEKLGRELHRSDFTDAPINSLTIWGGKSPRLANRLQRVKLN